MKFYHVAHFNRGLIRIHKVVSDGRLTVNARAVVFIAVIATLWVAVTKLTCWNTHSIAHTFECVTRTGWIQCMPTKSVISRFNRKWKFFIKMS